MDQSLTESIEGQIKMDLNPSEMDLNETLKDENCVDNTFDVNLNQINDKTPENIDSNPNSVPTDTTLNEDITSDEEVMAEEDDDDDEEDSKDESMDSDSDIPVDDIDNMLEEGLDSYNSLSGDTSNGNKRKRKLDEMKLQLNAPHEERKKVVLKSNFT